MKTGKTLLAILGFLSWKPMSGYDIKRLVDVSLSYFWTVSYGQIYPTLKRLVSAGYAVEEVGPQTGNRPRQQYRITPEGVAVFEEWMREPVDLTVQRDEMQLKLFLGGQRDRGQTAELIRDFRVQQVTRLQTLRAEYEETRPWMETGEIPDDFNWLQPDGLRGKAKKKAAQEQSLIFLLSIRQGILKAEARIVWCDEALEWLEHPPYESTGTAK